jgi:putative hydrolase of the HAD superfamily
MSHKDNDAQTGQPLRVVFFDAAETLFHVNGSVADIYLRHAVQYGYQPRPDSVTLITDAFRRAFHDAPPPVFAATESARIKQSERLWWFDVVHNVFYRVGMFERFDEFFEHVFDVFADPLCWKMFPEVVPTLTELRSHGLELGIVSNFDSRLFNILRGLGIAELFHTVTISSLAHAAKPSPKIFRLALDQHAVEPAEAMHVGDSVRDDVEGATKAGLTAVLLARHDQQSPPGIQTIRALDELIPLALSRGGQNLA